MRQVVLCLAAAAVLSGCFAFNNPYENGVPGAQFQIVVSGTSYAGTYVWNPQDLAYETAVGATLYYLYMDLSSYWCVSNSRATQHDSALGYYPTANAALPSSLPSWSPTAVGVDASRGGVCSVANPNGGTVGSSDTLQVLFINPFPGGSATYEWQRLSAENGTVLATIGTGSTYHISYSNDSGKWIRVIVTPVDSTGRVIGTPTASQPVHVG